MNPFSFSIPQNIYVGSKSFDKLARLGRELGKSKAFLLSGPNLFQSGLVERAVSLFTTAGMEADYFVDIEANPSVSTVERATEAFLQSGADFIVALGGGSPMDVAKAVAVVAKYGGSITEYEGAHKVPGKVIPMIAVPTTAGTGSEVTAFSVITDHARNYKFTIFSYELLPECAVLDPDLLETVPASVAAACGIDAFIHALEAYLSLDASPFSEAMSEKAMELIGSSVRAYVANRRDKKAASDMLVGSLFAGIAFSFARLGNVHAMSHPVSAFYDVPHGVANGVLLPVVLEYNALADTGKYRKIDSYIKRDNKGLLEFEPQMLVTDVRALLCEIGIPQTLMEAICKVKGNEEITVEEVLKNIDAMAADALKSGNIAVNPRSSGLNDIINLYKAAL